jgi:hypothetical protein
MPFKDITLAAIAAEAGLALSDFQSLRTREALIVAMFESFDRAMSADGALLKGPPRERLFDAIMLRFEAMEPQRTGLAEILAYAGRSPTALIRRSEAHLRAAQWALASTGLDTDDGAPRSVKALILARVIGKTEAAWREDKHGDFARTMAELDKSLREAEDRLAWFSRFGRRADDAPTSDAEPQPE